ncbi:MBL fold metallo-hydrolase [Nocardia macrotermitis]|uniref:Putative metallo-hydrolase YflN n=1 Tax=Nocardia macrotermitis TaxID=2585198 RepID=A0A7K0CZF1_9NOCA|nr:MBL fold metallo-hydrolase [Nocardia macrotermitis]MQY18332.1 putative metallo-hydrolase YflN [Nocardia macrotermitis]
MKIEQVSDSVHVVAGTNVNWALVSDGSGVTVIDAGYPGDTDDVLKSVREIGHQFDDIAAVLLTHAHLDHIGAIPTLVERFEVPIYTGPEEVRHAKRKYLQQISPAQMAARLLDARGRRWLAQTLRVVGRHLDVTIPTATTADEATLAALPGGIVAIPTPGHTDGHTAYLLPSEGVLFSGDTLITGHLLSAHTGLQLLPTFFNHNESGTRASAAALAAQPAHTLVPGHGSPVEYDPAELTALFGSATG